MLKSLGLWKVSTYSTGPKSSLESETSDLESYKTDEGSMQSGMKKLDKTDMADTSSAKLLILAITDGDDAPPPPEEHPSRMRFK